jgi:hypothetical protein
LSSADWSTFNGKQAALTNPVTGTGAAGRVAYWNGAGTITSDSLFQWNDTFKRLGIGRTPTVSLDVTGAGFFSTSVTASSLIKSGGTSSEFLKADGSVDSNSYALNSSLSLYLPLSGGTMTGILNVGSGNLRIAAEGASNITILRNFTGTAQGQSGFNHIGFNNSNNLYFTKNLNNGCIFSFNNSTYRTYTFPDADATIASTSNLSAYLPLVGGTLTGALNGTSGSFSGNLGAGVSSFSAWSGGTENVLQVKSASIYEYGGYETGLSVNAYYNSGWKYIGTNVASQIVVSSGAFTFNRSVSGTAGNAISWIPSLTLASTGAATFSSSVTALNGVLSGTGSSFADGLRINRNSNSNQYTVINHVGGATNIISVDQTGNNIPEIYFGRSINGSTISNSMMINKDGNVGIGTDSPVLENGGGQVIYNSTVPRLAFRNSTSGTTALDGTDLALVSSDFYVFNREAGSVIIGAGGTERMRITSGGYLKASNNGVYNNATGTFHELTQNLNGASSAILTHGGTSDPYGLEVNFTGHDPNNATNYMFGAYKTSGGFVWIYRIFSNGTVSARSDARWKKNIETTRNGYIEDLCKLRVVKYNWYNHEDDAPKELGLIAQEVEEVFPNLIQIDPVIAKREVEQEDGTIIEEEFEDGVSRSIKTSVLPFMLLKAMQEQQEQIKELQIQIDSLKNQIK